MKNLDKNFIKELKYAILESRYRAARSVNKELIADIPHPLIKRRINFLSTSFSE